MNNEELINNLISIYEDKALAHAITGQQFESDGYYVLAETEYKERDLFYELIAQLKYTFENEKETLLKENSSVSLQEEYIPINLRLPNKKEYLKNDGRFIGTDGNRKYPVIFDFYAGKFKHYCSLEEDLYIKAWCELP